MEEPVRFIATVQIGITIFSILLGAIGEPLLAHFFDPLLPRTVSFLLGFAILTYLGLVVGELVPKALALQHAERIAVVVDGRSTFSSVPPTRSSCYSRARPRRFYASAA